MINKEPFLKEIDTLKEEGKYRIFNSVLRERGKYPKAMWYSGKGQPSAGPKNIIHWCANDYLGMSQHKVVIDAARTALEETGLGAGGTRNIGGTTHYHDTLEREIARLHSKESALLFTSAFNANEWSLIVLKTIIQDLEFVSDSKNHASLIGGIRHSRAPKHIFEHNNMDDLRAKLDEVKGTPCIVFESVYSMDGYVSKIKEILDIADEYNAVTFLDEVHAVGLYGPTGAGYAEKLGLADRVDIINGTLAKAFGCQGGYIAGDDLIMDVIRSKASGFIFTTSLSPVVCAGAYASVRYLRQHSDLREMHQKTAKKLKNLCKMAEIDILENVTHIVPVMVRDAKKCKALSDELLYDHDIYVQPINYPTVPVGTERLRFCPTPLHTEDLIYKLIDSLKKVLTLS